MGQYPSDVCRAVPGLRKVLEWVCCSQMKNYAIFRASWEVSKEGGMRKGGGQQGWRRPQRAMGTVTPALGFWLCFLGMRPLLHSACVVCAGSALDRGLLPHGLEALDFGAHFPCLQAQARAQALLGSPGLGAVRSDCVTD